MAWQCFGYFGWHWASCVFGKFDLAVGRQHFPVPPIQHSLGIFRVLYSALGVVSEGPISLAHDFFGSRSFGTDASSNSPFPASSLVADVRGDVSEDCSQFARQHNVNNECHRLMVVEG